ncbi:MAG: branched-chain amino acid transaminase [bacterium]
MTMPETKKIWLDGKMVDWASANTHVLTHTLHYGGGVFEGIRAYNTDQGPAVFRLKEHVDRLFYSASCLEMAIPFSKDEIKEAVLETIRVNEIKEGYIRPLAFFGYGKMGLNPVGSPVQAAIAVWPWEAFLGEKPVKVKISKYSRLHPGSVVSDAKICGYYVNSILASQDAKKFGFDESLLLDTEGNIAEGPGENIFIVKDKKIYTPALGSILPGITRSSVMEIAGDLGFSVKEKKISITEIKSADEAFFTGTAVEVCPIGIIDNTEIGVGPISAQIKETYKRTVSGQEQKYLKWLTLV